MKTLTLTDELRHHFKVHARRRLEERYGLNFDNSTWNEIRGKMGESKFLRKDPSNENRVERELLFRGVCLRFVWDKSFNEIVTFLPPRTAS